MNEAAELIVAGDATALANAVAADVAARAREAISARGRFDIALAGGSTPKAAYALLGSARENASVAWQHVRFFFGDERCVPPTSDQSNYRMAAEQLLRPLAIADSAVFRMHGEAEPAEAARSYAETLRRELPGRDGTPSFDLIMLGMGPDGHTASLFPGKDPYTDDAALVRAPFVEKFATFRLTLTPRVLTAARAVVVVASGESKAAAFAAVQRSDADPTTYPIAVLRSLGGRLTWLVDRAVTEAAS